MAAIASTTVRIVGLEGVLATLRQLPPELVSKGGGPVRAALRKAAVVIQAQVRENLRAIVLAPNVGGFPNESTGLLDKNIAVIRGKKPAGQNGETYYVRVRNKKYPKTTGKKPVSTAQVARLLEYGTERRAPMPFIRPAFEQRKQEALDVFTAEINKSLERIVKKLERQNRVKG